MIVSVYNQNKEKTGEIKLPKEIFGVDFNPDLVWQVVYCQRANQRQKSAKTKDRSEVSGGGRKPWRQKGTGRARHGSIRSPLWRGGGVTFGSQLEKVLKKRIPKKMRRKALFMVLSAKLKENLIFILEELKIDKPKTKKMTDLLKKFFSEKDSKIIVLPKKDDNLIKSTRNIPKTKTIRAQDLNVLDLLSFKYILMPKKSVEVIKNTFLKKQKK